MEFYNTVVKLNFEFSFAISRENKILVFYDDQEK